MAENTSRRQPVWLGNAHGTEALGGRDEGQPHSLGQEEEGFLRPGETLGNDSGLPQDPAL